MVGIPARNETFPGVSDIADTARGCTGTGIEVCALRCPIEEWCYQVRGSACDF